VARDSDKPPQKQRSRGGPARPDARLEEALRQLGAAILNAPVPASLYRALHATPPIVSPGEDGKDELNTPPATDHNSFRDLLTFSIACTIGRNRALLRRILKNHISDDARDMLARRVVKRVELSGFTIDESAQVMTKRRPPLGHGSAASAARRPRAVSSPPSRFYASWPPP
jgi:hypothetical protein